jgi:hypothetical protein
MGVVAVVLLVAVVGALGWAAWAFGLPPRREWAGKNEIVLVTRWEWPVLIASGDPETRRALTNVVFAHTGRYRVRVAPGWAFWALRYDEVHRFDVRGYTFTTDPVEILTQDLVPVTFTANVAVQVVDPIVAVTVPPDWQATMRRAANAFVRRVVSTYKVSELVTKRMEVRESLMALLTPAARSNGFLVLRFDPMDVVLPKELHRPLARAAEAEREALAVAIAAQGERDAAALFADAAERMGEERTAFELRVLRMLQATALDGGTVVAAPGRAAPWPPPVGAPGSSDLTPPR